MGNPVATSRSAHPALAWLGMALVSFALLGGVCGCSPVVQRTAVPGEWVGQAQIPGMPHVRYWGDRLDPELQAELIQVAKERPPQADPNAEEGPGLGGLVLSGGGDRGAYGAGLLCGWTNRGTRPRFRIVTGVSTGALIAPMAFLGPKYDAALRGAYTKLKPEDVFRQRSFLDWLKYDSVADSQPLARMLQREFPDEVLRAIAAEHAKGRRLFVQTVNLDAQRPVVWDMGAIASSHHPDAPALFRQVLLASASIPGIFPPQYIKVQADGRIYDEMHVDGGTASQMLMSTLPVDLAVLRREMKLPPQAPAVYVVRNGFVRPEWQQIQPKIIPIIGRAIASMIKSQAHTELSLMYHEARNAGMDFYLSYIPNEYQRQAVQEFDTQEMNRMFNLGYQEARYGEPWRRTPPRSEIVVE